MGVSCTFTVIVLSSMLQWDDFQRLVQGFLFSRTQNMYEQIFANTFQESMH